MGNETNAQNKKDQKPSNLVAYRQVQIYFVFWIKRNPFYPRRKYTCKPL